MTKAPDSSAPNQRARRPSMLPGTVVGEEYGANLACSIGGMATRSPEELELLSSFRGAALGSARGPGTAGVRTSKNFDGCPDHVAIWLAVLASMMVVEGGLVVRRRAGRRPAAVGWRGGKWRAPFG